MEGGNTAEVKWDCGTEPNCGPQKVFLLPQLPPPRRSFAAAAAALRFMYFKLDVCQERPWS